MSDEPCRFCGSTSFESSTGKCNVCGNIPVKITLPPVPPVAKLYTPPRRESVKGPAEKSLTDKKTTAIGIIMVAAVAIFLFVTISYMALRMFANITPRARQTEISTTAPKADMLEKNLIPPGREAEIAAPGEYFGRVISIEKCALSSNCTVLQREILLRLRDGTTVRGYLLSVFTRDCNACNTNRDTSYNNKMVRVKIGHDGLINTMWLQ